MMYLINSDNPYSDWISLDLSFVEINSRQWDLETNLSFSENWQPLLKGRIKWGLKGGQLKVTLENGQLLIASVPQNQDFLISTSTKVDDHIWILNSKTIQEIKTGDVSFKLGTFIPNAETFNLTATFTPTLADFSITDAEGLWKHDISPNQHGVLERAIARFLQQNYSSPYISFVQWGTHTASFEANRLILQENLTQLDTLIEQIYNASSDDLIELAKIASLNPFIDLRGGNLIATQLSGLSLGNANLYQTNFRGANLTDIDLSEANLSCAKFSGADLSGAYLGNANLSYADLHRASLALSNLIGADLTGANLLEANLSNANLSGAKLVDARFGNNPGLTEAMQEMIKDRGGHFE
ncbi:pentapeptide repeat-containing protein [Aphanothece hegewaldii CCALA 016]|uniref:Pentapeptide repeat-containing protein n=1 Tax=Aphanothece hegewaldii CCALA 016 TaxID=2107694 RepID=A0A2T1LXG4_9CHRO|nr:pentapeptide repeat-containing protein [Aphanothece hegewaldii]PSF37077.1 pentapeptide repeat-containing protein [Aphanothece hegewaldii CCALA 016]